MRLIRILCLGIAVSIGIAGAGAGSATASAICDAHPFAFEEEEGSVLTSCAEAFAYGVDVESGDTLSGTLAADSPHGVGPGELVFVGENPEDEISCTESQFDGAFDSVGESSIEGEMTNLTFGSCTTTIPSCTVTSLTSVTPIEAQAEYIGGFEDGELTLQQPETTAELSCLFGIFEPTCTYEGGEAATVLMDFYNPENTYKPSSGETAIADVTDEYALSEPDSLEICPETGTVHATYEVTADNGLSTDVHMAQVRTGTRLCEEEPKPVEPAPKRKFLVCEKKTFSGKIEGEATAAATFKASGTAEVVTCSKAPFSGDYLSNGRLSTKTLVVKYEGAGAGNTCTSNLKGNPDVAVALSTNAFPNSMFVYEQVSAPQGSFVLTVSSTESKNLKLRTHLTIKAGKEPKCIYIATVVSSKVTNGFGGAPTTIKKTQTLDFEKEEPPEDPKRCPAKLSHEVTLKLNGINGDKKPHVYLAYG